MGLLLLLQGAPAPPPATPPAEVTVRYLKRVSPSSFLTTLDQYGHPEDWTPSSTVVEDWGYLQVTFNGEDVTFLRDAACEVVSYSFAEPFGSETAVIRFPQISPFDDLGAGDLAPFTDACEVEIRRVYWSEFNEERVDPDWGWYGQWVSEEIEHDESSGGTTFHCTGVLYRAALRTAVPSLDPVLTTDVAGLIWDALNDPTQGFAPPVIPQDYPNPGDFGIGVVSTHLGAYQSVLDLVQDYLALAYDPLTGVQWTVTNDGREAEIVLKDTTTIHYSISVGAQGLTCRLSRDLTMSPNAIYGSGQSTYDGCEWRNAFYPGLIDGNLFGHHIQPISVDTAVAPYLYDSDGVVTGANPDYDPDVLRVDRYENFGRLDKLDATGSAALERLREQGVGYHGTLSLRIDPEEGSRWGIMAGTNIALYGLRDSSPVLHIARVEAFPPQLKVSLTVDTRARDLPTLGAVIERRRDNTDLVRRDRPTRNASRIVNDRVSSWDCESGAGYFYAEPPALGWSVVQVAVGTRGVVRAISLQASSAVELAVGVFDRYVTAGELAAAGTPADADYWDWETWPDGSGLVQAVGAGDDLGGYWPLAASDEDAVLTGRIFNDQSWSYVSQAPPWLWVAVWATGSVSVTGQLYPGPQGAS